MSSTRLHNVLGTLATAAALLAGPASAQGVQSGQRNLSSRHLRSEASDTVDETGTRVGYSFKSRTDSLAWARARALANKASGMRLVVSLQDRHLWAIIGRDTVLSAPVAVAKGTTLDFGKREWKFDTPRGMRTVLGKEADPIWQPPEWLYAETALEYDLRLGHLTNGQPIRLSDGRKLAMKDGVAGVYEDGEFAELPTDEHIVFDNTLFIPPEGTKHRSIKGELGHYRLDLGEGYLLHGTPYTNSIGAAVTHGCVRLADDDIEWLFENVPVGTKVYFY
jgi:hypothetical protein